MSGPLEGAAPIKDRYYAEFVAGLPNELAGKTYAITGTSSGTGLSLALFLAERDATVIMLNRDSSRAEEALDTVKAASKLGTVSHVSCDLQSFKSVRAAADTVRALTSELDALVLNAGIALMKDVRTGDGLDVQAQVNFLSQFVLTARLWPLLVQAGTARGPSRVVSHSSISRKQGKRLTARYFEPAPEARLGGDGFMARSERYHQSKLANVAFTRALEDRINASGAPVVACVAHPGGAASGILVKVKDEAGVPSWGVRFLFKYKFQSINDGALGLIHCTAGQDVVNGDFWGPGSGYNAFRGRPRRIGKEAKSSSAAAKDMLWRTAQQVTGEVFEI